MGTGRSSIKETIYNGIIDLIGNGTFKPGEIITEKMIIERFCYSKSPVREAMLELCKDDILKNIPRCGYQVTQITPKTMHEITEMRILLELSNFRQIRDKYSPAEIEAIFAPMEKVRKIEKKNTWEANQNNLRFHTALVELSGNSLLKETLKKVLDMYTRAYTQMYMAMSSVLSPKQNHYHDLFLNAWKAGNLDDAEDYLKKDILLAENAFTPYAESTMGLG